MTSGPAQNLGALGLWDHDEGVENKDEDVANGEQDDVEGGHQFALAQSLFLSLDILGVVGTEVDEDGERGDVDDHRRHY